MNPFEGSKGKKVENILSFEGEEKEYSSSKEINELTKLANKIKRDRKGLDNAEGPGALTQGGYGGKTLYVTTNEDTGKEGSFRWAVEQDYPRIIKFKVGGLFSLNSKIKIDKPQVTVDGSDQEVTFKDGTLYIESVWDVILTQIRIRPGDEVTLKKGKWKKGKRNDKPKDALTVENSVYVLIDHVSCSWGSDELLSVTGCRNVTVQNCLLGEPLSNPKLHIENGKEISHPYGALHSGDRVLYSKTLIAYFKIRGTQMGSGKIAFVNCSDFNYGESGTRITADAKDYMDFIIVGNYYVIPMNNGAPMIEIEGDSKLGNDKRIFIYGNIGPERSKQNLPQWQGVSVKDVKNIDKWKVDSAMWDIGDYNLLDTTNVKEYIIANVGAVLPKRDGIDARIIDLYQKDIKGEYVMSQDDVGGYAT